MDSVRLALLVSVLALASASFAATPKDYEIKFTKNQHGNTVMSGISSKGKAWHTVFESGGSTSGIDRNGHKWRHDVKTGNYFNYGTGRYCVGEISKRICR